MLRAQGAAAPRHPLASSAVERPWQQMNSGREGACEQ